MERLTTNKDVSEMGMYELAHNGCYIKDGEARYRDFEIDMSARDFARNLMTTLRGEDLPVDDDEFDEEILENLQYDPFADTIGLIALFYRNLWAMAELREDLKEYEDAEEQGRLVKLPCHIGDSIYSVVEDGLTIVELKFSLDFYARRKNDFGKTVFLAKSEAEAKLKELRGEENDG